MEEVNKLGIYGSGRGKKGKERVKVVRKGIKKEGQWEGGGDLICSKLPGEKELSVTFATGNLRD